MIIPKVTKILYMVSRSELMDEVEKISSNGNIVTCLTHLREMREPNVDGVVITDWLIVYYPKGEFSIVPKL